MFSGPPSATPRPFAADPLRDRVVWRVSVPPASGAAVAAAVRTEVPEAEALFDWAGGLVWLALSNVHAETVRGAIAGCGGHATLIRASDAQRAAVPVFEPQPDGLAALSRRVKAGFDPQGLLNPGRMGA